MQDAHRQSFINILFKKIIKKIPLENLEAITPALIGKPYIWQFRGALPGPTVSVVGAMHGNEFVGVHVVEQVLKLARNGIHAGVLNVMIGNPAAYEYSEDGVRFIKENGGQDMNRLFGDDPDDCAAKERVELMKPFLAESDLMLDIHSTLKPSEPMLIIPEMKHKLAAVISELGIARILTGPGLQHPSGQNVESDTFVAGHGGLGITIEAGWQNEIEVEKVIGGVLKALLKVGIFNAEQLSDLVIESSRKTLENFKVANIYQQVFAGADGFQWNENLGEGGNFKNFEPVSKGTTIGWQLDGGIKKPIILERNSRILFQKSNGNIMPKNQVCYLVEAEDGVTFDS